MRAMYRKKSTAIKEEKHEISSDYIIMKTQLTLKQILEEFDRVWYISYQGSIKDGKYSQNAHRWVMQQKLKQSIKDALESCRVEKKKVPLEAFQEKDIPGIALFDQITGWNANTHLYDEKVKKFMGEEEV